MSYTMKKLMIIFAICLVLSSNANAQNIFQNLINMGASLIKLFLGNLSFLEADLAYSGEEFPESTPRNQQYYDYIIVGAGSAGCALASRLSEIKNATVLLIEAGGQENLIMDIPFAAIGLHFTPINYRYLTEPSNEYCRGMVNNQCVWPMAKVTGGNSAFNFMIATRGNRKDYDSWAEETGDSSWNSDSMLRYFKKLETFNVRDVPKSDLNRNYNGPIQISYSPHRSPFTDNFVEAGQQLGYSTGDYNSGNQTGFFLMQSTMKNGERWSVNRAYLHPIRNRKNLFVTRNSQVTKILINDLTKEATGVLCVKNSKTISVRARKEVIISAGTIETPKLLMLSGIGPIEHLESLNIKVIKDAPGVGENLQDHPSYAGLIFTVNKPVGLITSRILNPLNPYLNQYLSKRQGPLSDPYFNAISWFNVDNPQDEKPNMELLFSGGTMVQDIFSHKVVGISQKYWNEFYARVFEKDAFQIWPTLMKPLSKGKLLLRSTNPKDKPKLYANYFENPDDIRVLIKGIRMAIKVTKTEALKKYGSYFHDYPVPGCEKFIYDSDEYWECALRTLIISCNHHVGSCKMGKRSDPLAVVDSHLKVIGVKKLRIVDASIMPSIPTGHVNLPTIAIAEKIADVIKDEWD